MPDRITSEQRSALMGKIRAKNTKPELAVRSLVHRLGYRFRLHARDLPGSPDIVFPSRKKVIFVHGCFWHWHPRCAIAKIPKTRTNFWTHKLQRNRERDFRKITQLQTSGWQSLVVWECELSAPHRLQRKLAAFLEKQPRGHGSQRDQTRIPAFLPRNPD